MSLPWDDLADAFERLHQAERHGAPDEVAEARAEVERGKDHLAALGNLLMYHALQKPGRPVQRLISACFGLEIDATWDRATKASKRATWACNEVDVLKQRITELEELVARLTPGIGEPPAATQSPHLRVIG